MTDEVLIGASRVAFGLRSHRIPPRGIRSPFLLRFLFLLLYTYDMRVCYDMYTLHNDMYCTFILIVVFIITIIYAFDKLLLQTQLLK